MLVGVDVVIGAPVMGALPCLKGGTYGDDVVTVVVAAVMAAVLLAVLASRSFRLSASA